MDPASVTYESRKLRNRLSQKAHRARQCMRIKELEERLDSRPLSEGSRVVELEKQNVFLRDQLLTCHKKLESLQVTLSKISDATAVAVGLETSGSKRNDRKDSRTSDGGSPIKDDNYTQFASQREDDDSDDSAIVLDISSKEAEISEIPDMNMNDTYLNLMTTRIDANEVLEKHPEDQHLSLSVTQRSCNFSDSSQLLGQSLPQSGGPSAFTTDNVIPSLFNQTPLNFSFAQMGPAAYADLSAKGPLLVQGSHGQLRRTNSLFSDHITVVEYFLRQKWINVGALISRGDDCLAQSVSFMLSSFVCMSWHMMTAWHTYTKAHVPVGKLMTWHLNPTPELYRKISANYKPTHLQLSTTHPSIIDWIPWPVLRDKLILCHSANPRIDELICEVGNSYVAEGDLSNLIANVRPGTMGFVGVWNLVRAIAPEATTHTNGPSQEEVWSGAFDTNFTSGGFSPQDSLDDSDADIGFAHQLPAPSVDALFNTKALALQAFELLGMNQGAVTFRLDPAFLEQHPELYDCKSSLIAKGISLRPSTRCSVPAPRPLDKGLLSRYKELTMWAFDLSFDRAASHEMSCAA